MVSISHTQETVILSEEMTYAEWLVSSEFYGESDLEEMEEMGAWPYAEMLVKDYQKEVEGSIETWIRHKKSPLFEASIDRNTKTVTMVAKQVVMHYTDGTTEKEAGKMPFSVIKK